MMKDTKTDPIIPNLLSSGEKYYTDTFRAIQKYQAIKGDVNFEQLFKNITQNKVMSPEHMQNMYEMFNSNNPIPQNFAQSLKDAFSQIGNITATLSQGE
jgi:hypothetical protein